MKNLFEVATVQEVKERMEQLRPDSRRQWGTMSPAQALAHCSAAIEMAVGEKVLPQILIGRLLGRLAKKSMIVKEKPMPRNAGTHKSLVVRDDRDFAVERQRLRDYWPLCSGRVWGVHEASALLFRSPDSGGMGGVDVSASGSSSSAISGLVCSTAIWSSG